MNGFPFFYFLGAHYCLSCTRNVFDAKTTTGYLQIALGISTVITGVAIQVVKLFYMIELGVL